MMTAIRMERRRFLQLSAGLVALLAIPSVPHLTGGQEVLDPFAAQWQRLFSRPDSASAIGQVYLQANPQEADAAWLVEQITQDMAGRVVDFAGVRGDDLKTLLQERIRQDFAEENTVKLNGWMLARTEARLYALATLMRPARAGI